MEWQDIKALHFRMTIAKIEATQAELSFEKELLLYKKQRNIKLDAMLNDEGEIVEQDDIQK